MRILLLFLAVPALAQFRPATTACSMAHCDSRMSDQAVQVPPTVGVTGRMIDPNGGANIGLGCSTNNTIVACSGQAATASLTVYDRFGAPVCNSGSALDSHAYFSAPALNLLGQVAAADVNHVVMFDATSVTNGVCATVWASDTLTGSPVSLAFDPTNNLVLAATTSGWLYSIYGSGASAGTTKASVQMTFSGNTYVASNTPCVANGKIFVLTQRSGVTTDEKLFGFNTIDLSDATGWGSNPSAVSLTGPPFASPTCEGGYAIFDDSGGASGQARFVKTADGTAASFDPVALPATSIASYAYDSRGTGSVWMGLSGLTTLRQVSIVDGTLLGTVTIKDINGVSGNSVSALTIGGPPDAPYLIAGVGEAGNVRLVTMFSLVTGTPIWSVFTDSGANGQFPVVNTPDSNAVFWSTKTGGVWIATSTPSPSVKITGGVTISGGVTIGAPGGS